MWSREARQSLVLDVEFPHSAGLNLGDFRIGRGVGFLRFLPSVASFEVVYGGKGILAAGAGCSGAVPGLWETRVPREGSKWLKPEEGRRGGAGSNARKPRNHFGPGCLLGPSNVKGLRRQSMTVPRLTARRSPRSSARDPAETHLAKQEDSSTTTTQGCLIPFTN